MIWAGLKLGSSGIPPKLPFEWGNDMKLRMITPWILWAFYFQTNSLAKSWEVAMPKQFVSLRVLG